MAIKFGTDGWRGKIAEDFNYENLRLVSQAIAEYLRARKGKMAAGLNPTIVPIGYDNRFMSEDCARQVGNVFSANGLHPIISKTAVPTPVISYAVSRRKAALGIMITASHNPFYFNGLKIKISSGSSAPETLTKEIENICHKKLTIKNLQQDLPVEDFALDYVRHIRNYLKKIDRRNLPKKIAVDPLFGSGIGFIENYFKKEKKMRIVSIHSRRDPYFGGVNPEPIDENLAELKRVVVKEKASIGIALDGDADRIGLVDEKGKFVNSHQIFSLLLLHFIRNYKKSGGIAKTISGSFLINRIAEKYSLPLRETPIGFKYIAELLEKKEVFMGGEESGGLGLPGHIPERDGVLSGILILERMSLEKKTLLQLTNELTKEFGPSFYGRVDLKLKKIPDKNYFTEMLVNFVKQKNIFSDLKEIKNYDGVKFIFKNDSWLLLRSSGTEPILRIYAEDSTQQGMQKFLALGKKIIYTHFNE